MIVSEYMKKHGLTDEALDAMAAPYESGEFQGEEGAVYSGSHFDVVGKRRVTVIYDAQFCNSDCRIPWGHITRLLDKTQPGDAREW